MNGAIMPGHRVSVPNLTQQHEWVCDKLHASRTLPVDKLHGDRKLRVLATLASDFGGGCVLRVNTLQVARFVDGYGKPASIREAVSRPRPATDAGITHLALALVKQSLNEIDQRDLNNPSGFSFDILETAEIQVLRSVFGFDGEHWGPDMHAEFSRYEFTPIPNHTKDIRVWDARFGDRWDVVASGAGLVIELNFYIQKLVQGKLYKFSGKVQVAKMPNDIGQKQNYRQLMIPIIKSLEPLPLTPPEQSERIGKRLAGET
jgi:hypothetical protein